MHVQFTSYIQGDISKVSMNSKKETKTISCFTKFHLFFVLNQVWFNPFQSISIHPKNVRPPEVFWYFQGVQKWNMGLKWVNHIFWRNINSSGYGTNKMSAYRSTCSTIFLAKSFPNCKFLNYHYLRVKLWYAANTCQICNLSVLKDLASAQSPNKLLNKSKSLSAFFLFFCLFLVYNKAIVQFWKFSNINRK